MPSLDSLKEMAEVVRKVLAKLAKLLRRVVPTEEIRSQQAQLFRRLVFDILMDNTDDHEKSHALLWQPNGRYPLSPAFDVVPSAHGLGYQAMLVGDRATQSTLVNALSQARQFGLKVDAARALISEVAAKVAGWKEAFSAQGLAANDIDLLRSTSTATGCAASGKRFRPVKVAGMTGRRSWVLT